MAEPTTGLSRPRHQFTRRGRVTINPDEAVFPADIVLEGDGGAPLLWNGFIACPLLSLADAQSLVQLCNRIPFDLENPRFVWVPNPQDENHPYLLKFEWDGSPLDTPDDSNAVFTRDVISPDHAGRYAIGAWSWTWIEVEDLDRLPLEACAGDTPECPHYDCPDGFHPDGGCACTPDCRLADLEGTEPIRGLAGGCPYPGCGGPGDGSECRHPVAVGTPLRAPDVEMA